MLQTGDRPDDFTLLDHEGHEVCWTSMRGGPVVVFLYPKASTPGCTKEACAFRDLAAEFGALGVSVLGMSADSVKRQSNFHSKNGLAHRLLSDPEKVVLDAWGVWGDKKLYGKIYQGIIRSTFLFDADGVVVRAWPKVRVKGHVDEVLAAARELMTS